MTNDRPDALGRRARRTFSVEFKQEMIRLLCERRRAGGSVAQVGSPDQLRS